MNYEAHEQFRAESNGQKQQRYVFRLAHRVPAEVLAELTGGTPSEGRPEVVQRSPRGRRPATLDAARTALSYVLGDLHRVMVPAHHNYQVRLKAFLKGRGIQAEGERDFVDVRFEIDGSVFIGEVKVTSHFLRRDEAFRVALGQLLFYGHLRFEQTPGLLMFLDFEPAPDRMKIATGLGIGVVTERQAGTFVMLNPEVAPALAVVFPSSDSAVLA